MRQRIILTLVLAAFTAVSAIAQKSMLVAYDGGYFVKDGKKWCEYRPTDRAGKWAEYKQYKESEEFFYLKNKKCRVAVPKITKDKIFIKREKKKEWEVVYTPLNIYTLCPEGGAPFYCYSSGSSDGNGYFVRDNNKWREYRPLMKRSRWAEFQQSSENSKYFIVESKHNIVYIPKSKEYNFIIKKTTAAGREATPPAPFTTARPPTNIISTIKNHSPRREKMILNQRARMHASASTTTATY